MAKKKELKHTAETVYLYKSTLMNNAQGVRDWNLFTLTAQKAKESKLPVPPLNIQGVPNEKRHGNVRKNTFYVMAHEIPNLYYQEDGKTPKKKFEKEPFQVLEYKNGGAEATAQVVTNSNDAELIKKEQEIENLKKQLEAHKQQMELNIIPQPDNLSGDKE